MEIYLHCDVLVAAAEPGATQYRKGPAHKLRPFRNLEPEQARVPEPAVLRQPLGRTGVEPRDMAHIWVSDVTGGHS